MSVLSSHTANCNENFVVLKDSTVYDTDTYKHTYTYIKYTTYITTSSGDITVKYEQNRELYDNNTC